MTIRSGLELAAFSPKAMDAKHVVIVGGGLIGTELAGEFATRRPDIKVTIVHSQPRLLERNTPSVSAYAKKFLEERGVTIVFGEKVVDHKGSKFVTDSKRVIQADVGFWCAGIQVDSSFMQGFSPSAVSSHHSLIVNEHLQLQGYPNVFVGGDIVDIDEEKNAAHANSHAGVILQNIERMNRGQHLLSYRSTKEPVDICLGSWDGIIIYPPFLLPGFIAGIGKVLVEKIALARLRY